MSISSDDHEPGTVATRDELVEMYRRMCRIRRFEERAHVLYQAGKIPGFLHLGLGQEASAVGACFRLRARDVITSTHRGHAHVLAKGLDSGEMFAELMGRQTGVCHGRGGSMHIADPEKGIFGANGIVGAGLPIAGGAAFAADLRAGDDIVVAFLGDGAITTGAFHEAANLAALWGLPLILYCENNRFSEFSDFEDQHPVEVRERARAYGMTYRQVDGNDVAAVDEVMTDVLADVRRGNGPYLVESLTLRSAGHYVGDSQLYRKRNEPDSVADPLDVTRSQLVKAGVPGSELDEVERLVDVELDRAVSNAEAAPHPDPAGLFDGFLRARDAAPPAPVDSGEDPGAPTWKLYQAVGAALRAELAEDPSVFLAGIDIGKGGNVFAITRGLYDEWPDRVRDTPISETAIMGLATGAAMAGLRPVVELMYFDFLGVCLDQLMNQAAKLPFMTGGRARMALTVRTQFGAGKSSGAQHSQSLEAMLAHIPGLTVVMPSTPSDAYGLLRAAIQDPNPVVFVENRLQYGTRGPQSDPAHLVPIGQAAIRRQGRDITIVSYSRMARVCQEAADELAERGISAEVIDLRTIAPLDMTTVLNSVAKTNRLLIAHEATRDFGVGAEIAAQVAGEGIWYLDAPIVRVGAPTVPAPYSPSLESRWLPDRARIVEAGVKLANA
jgi:2-oxoisovalerate dehydrogenase E1 component